MAGTSLPSPATPPARTGSPPVLRVGLLGGFRVDGGAVDGEHPVPGPWRLRKAKSVVKVLALAPGHALHRDQLVELLWPERSAASGANNLHQALHAARRALHAPWDAALTLQDDLVALGRASGVAVAVDVDAFETAAAQATGTARPEPYRRALSLYAGDLLPEDQYEQWATVRRADLLAQRRGLLVGLARVLHDAAEDDEAARVLGEALAVDPLDEQAGRLLMQVHAAAGRRQEALEAYGRLRRELADQTGARPDAQTQRLHAELLTGPWPTGRPGRRTNLPLSATSFVGRRREVEDTEALLARTRLLTLTGPGGCGKTRLALELARRRSTEHRDGSWLVELSAVQDPDHVAQAVASVLGVGLPISDPSPQALAAAVGRRDLLLVLDTCEHLVEGCAAVAAALLRACRSATVLATSREPLRVAGELCWRVPSLTSPPASLGSPEALARYESVQLFVARAQAARPEFRLDHRTALPVAAVCAGLDGIPLALELAAARVAHLSVQEVATRLDDALGLLVDGDRAALTRQQTLAATLSWSHALLTRPERVLLRRLSVFAGATALEDVERVCADPGTPSVVPALSRLVDKSLVLLSSTGGAVRYRLLDTVRQFAARELQSAGETDRLARRHLECCLDLAVALDLDHGGPVVRSPSARLDAAHDDLRAALRWAVDHDGLAALRLAVSLWRFWLARGSLREGARWLDEALAAAPGRTPLHASACFASAALDVRSGRGSALERFGRTGVEIARSLDDPAELARALQLRSLLCWLQGDWESTDRRSADAHSLAVRHDLPTTAVGALHVRGLLALSRGDVETGQRRLAEALGLLEQLLDEPRPFFSTATLGFMVEGTDSPVPVVSFEETVLLARRVGAAQAAGYLLVNLATASRLQGDHDRAARLLEDAEQRFVDLDDPEGRALALNLRGTLERVRGRPAAARALLWESIRLRRAVGDRRGLALAQANLGVALVAAGERARGDGLLRRAGLSFEQMDDRPGVACTGLNRAVAALLVGDERAAARRLRRARQVLQMPGTHRGRAWVTLALAGLSDGLEADGLRSAAAAQFDRLGMRRPRTLPECTPAAPPAPAAG